MDKVIRVLVFAKDSERALDAAHKVVHEKLKTKSEGGPFDYYVDFTECPKKDPYVIMEEAKIAALGPNGFRYGKDRFGPIPPVLQVSTARFPTDDKRGMEQAKEAFEAIRVLFNQTMTLIRYHIANYTNDELFGEVEGKGMVEIDGEKMYDNPSIFQNACESLGRVPEVCHLFTPLGTCVTRLAHLRAIVTDSDENPCFVDYSGGQDPDWGPHVWKQPLWIVPFHVHV